VTKFLNKWLRKIHRWLAIPMIIIVPAAIIIKLIGLFPPQLAKLQEILLLTLVLSGIYLYFIPYIAKWQRNRRQRARATIAIPQASQTNPEPTQE